MFKGQAQEKNRLKKKHIFGENMKFISLTTAKNYFLCSAVHFTPFVQIFHFDQKCGAQLFEEENKSETEQKRRGIDSKQ